MRCACRLLHSTGCTARCHVMIDSLNSRRIKPLTSSMPRKLPRAGGFPLFRPRSSVTRCHGSRAGTPGCKSSLGHLLPARQFPDLLTVCDADRLEGDSLTRHQASRAGARHGDDAEGQFAEQVARVCDRTHRAWIAAGRAGCKDDLRDAEIHGRRHIAINLVERTDDSRQSPAGRCRVNANDRERDQANGSRTNT